MKEDYNTVAIKYPFSVDYRKILSKFSNAEGEDAFNKRREFNKPVSENLMIWFGVHNFPVPFEKIPNELKHYFKSHTREGSEYGAGC